jgi:hypothetical protein
MAASMAESRDAMVETGDDPWTGSTNAWVKEISSSRKRGKVGELIAENWLRKLGMTVGRAGTSEADRSVNDHPVEIKLSTLWASGELRWQQIRDQNYTHAILIGIEPNDTRVWCVPKAVLRAHAVAQHGGAKGTDTMWLAVTADAIPAWMEPYGGELEHAAAVVTALLGNQAPND